METKVRRTNAVTATRFVVELDVHLIYQPPMADSDTGITVTRDFELPFAPYAGLKLYSRVWDDYPEPFGFELKDVVWDFDRSVFLATGHHISVGLPMAYIPS